jgi:cytidyltransferase-like protein
MKFLHYLNEVAKTTGKKKDLHLQHIEQIAAETGDIEFVKNVFEKVYSYLLGDTTEITITEKIDGVPILFGKTIKDGFFVALKNKAFERGKVNTSEMFFKKSDIKNIGDNTGLLQNLWDNLENKVKDNKVYFAELLFSDHSPESSNKQTKNQTKVRKEADFVLAQPNLLYYKIRGVKDSQKLGLLAIQSGSINDISTLTSETFKDSGFDFDGDSNLFLTDGKLSLKLNEKDPKIKALKKEIDSLKDINLLKDKKFGITQYMKSGNNKELLKISDIKEKFLKIFRTQRNILGLKGIDSDETLDEGLVIKSPDFMVKLVSKDFFLHAQGHYGQKFTGDRGKDISNFTVFFPGKFQPFHNGHLKTFQNLESQFGNGNVIIITSNSNEGLPLNFEDKKKLIMASGIPENAIKDRGSIPMYSFKMAQEFSDPMKSIAVYAIGDKEEDFGRIKENEAIKKVNINVSSSADFDKAKEMVIQSLNAPRENKIHYTFITNPVAIKDGNEDVKAGNIRKKLTAGKDISSLVPYNTKDKEIKNILNKFKEIKNESVKMKWSASLRSIVNESYFGKFISIFEGGNTTFDVGGKTYNVAKIDFVSTKESFSNFKKYLSSFLNTLSIEFGKEYERTIWPEGEFHFSGSSDVVLNKIESYIKDKNNKQKLIKDLFSEKELKSIDKQLLNNEIELLFRWLKKYKPKAGDIDIQVSEEKVFFGNLRKFLDSRSMSKGQEITMDEIAFLNYLKKECPNVGDICIIDNKPSIGQIITAAAIRQNIDATGLNDFLFFQCDWEPVEADEYGTPTEFAKLSRSSSIKDIEKGVKGREHKYLLRTLANVAGEIDTSDLKILSPKTLMPISSKDKGLFSFSVAKGLRKKYWNPNDLQDKKDIISYYKSNTKKPMSEEEIKKTLSGKNIRVTIPDNNKIYSTEISDIKKKLELKDIDSFVGLVEYLSKYKKSKAKEIYNLFSDKLIEQLTIAPSAASGDTLEEKIENAFKEDYDTKLIALKILAENLGIKSIKDFEMKYKEWKNKQKQVILAKGGKLSEKDMAV